MNELARLIDRFERWTGLDLRRGSSYTALERYLRLQLPADDPTALARYVDDVTTPHHPEAVRLVDAITVCHSTFYRDPEQLAGVTAVLRSDTSSRANIWVPACATGEDAYSLALISESVGRQASILATDINTRALAQAATGVYGPWSMRELPPSMALPRREDGRYEMPARLRRVITFTRHNLMDVTPSAGDGWDLILCRNVLMYITREKVVEVLGRLASALRPGGYLFVGANDILERPPPLLKFVRLGQRHVLWRPYAASGSAALRPPPAGSLLATLTPTPPVGTPVVPAAAAGMGGIPGLPAVNAPASASNPGIPVLSSVPSMPSMPSMPAITLPPMTPGAPAAPQRPATSSAPPSFPPAATFPPPLAGPATSSGSLGSAAPSPARAHSLLLDGDTATALEMVLGVLEADPLCVEARLIAGIAYQLSGDAQQAITALRAALVLAPDLWPAEVYQGFALFQLGDETGASRAVRRGAQLAATAERLPLSPSVATWFEGWRVDVIEMGRHARVRGRNSSPGG
jgi:chemotaxis protein methyltransferase CheR